MTPLIRKKPKPLPVSNRRVPFPQKRSSLSISCFLDVSRTSGNVAMMSIFRPHQSGCKVGAFGRLTPSASGRIESVAEEVDLANPRPPYRHRSCHASNCVGRSRNRAMLPSWRQSSSDSTTSMNRARSFSAISSAAWFAIQRAAPRLSSCC